MRLFSLVFILAAILGLSSAFTARKHESKRRPAFKTNSNPVAADEKEATPHTSPSSNTATFAFAPAVSYEAHRQDEFDDEEVIGYGTALISCIISLALGFGLGYGT